MNEVETILGDIECYQGSLYLSNGWELPDTLREFNDFCRVVDERKKNGKKLELPKIVDGDLELVAFSSAEDIVLPEKINGKFKAGFRSAKGLILSDIQESIELSALKSSEGLVLPRNFKGEIFLNEDWNEKEKWDIKEKYPNLKIRFISYHPT